MREPSPQSAAFARTLRKLRRDRYLSQEDLAGRSGISAKHIGEIERAAKEPRLTTLMRLASGLGVPAAEVIAIVELHLEAV
ncbi:helix-turn-helix domain-containing protein [Conexibacter sp. CPCC 206217]|uniref:helix-turn-helix domain-containing protein n=1 Tax=Conexibacter sp. CPCC 206217 TaxID=3064574 RepID=UPI00271F463C|nr:helix-turn-helix transcriptional regulator [Conexibacter sp. CPCC 206217]MDO8213450.1 helix-turn-helix transcriptional regulator [Conexibacter sp. CPCC 206217]